MTLMYEKLATPSSGLRLHLNENTGGCSPAVIDALRGLTTDDAAFYPDYSGAIAATAGRLGVPASHVLLTNGLDEGIFAAALTALRDGGAADPLEAVVIVPAFDMYAGCARAAGGRVVNVPLGAEFAFPLEETIAAITPATRVIFITTPHNPTGMSVPPDTVLAVAAAASGALVFVDEAYIDFGGETLVDRGLLDATPNLVVGRTFSKAYGLAGLRLGAVAAAPATLERLRACVPPYSINAAVTVALPAALGDTGHYQGYLAEVRESKRLLYAAFDRLGVRYWPSEANFVLARFDGRADVVVAALKSRGIYVRNRSSDPGCNGCVRITAGMVSHTQACLAVIEEVLCDAR